MASFNGPKLTNPIRTDVPDTQEVLVALAKQDPTSISDIPVGAKRLYEVSSGSWQWQEYNGSSWAAVPFLQHNVDQLDGYHAAITPAANTVAVRNASGLLQDSITGNAATASSAATLSQTLPVNKGGTGATTSEAARANLGVPPASHASANTTHGIGNATQYGHLKLSDATNSSSGATGGTAATPAAVKTAKETADAAQSSANNAQSSANAAMTKASTLATASAPGIVKPGTGMTVDAAGALNVDTASTSRAGIVLLNNTVTSTSMTQAATANAVKMAYDKAGEAASDAATKLGSDTAHIVKSYESEDGTVAYRKWSDGYIEVRMKLLQNKDYTTINFPVEFTKVPYCWGSVVAPSAPQRPGMCSFGLVTTTTFVPRIRDYDNGSKVDGANIYACGY